jgi:glucokinase
VDLELASDMDIFLRHDQYRSQVFDQAPAALRNSGWIERTDMGGWTPSRTSGLTIGLDLGGTKLRGAIADISGSVLNEAVVPTVDGDATAVLQQLLDMVRSLERSTGKAQCVAIGVPGAVARNGSVALSPHVAFPADRPLCDLLQASLNLPVLVENDVNLTAYGEYTERHLLDPDCDGLALVALGTGIGMGLVLDGNILRGRNGAAGEIATLPFGPDPFALAKANPTGAFEAWVSTAGILGRYRETGGHAASVRDIFNAADAGDAQAAKVIDQVIRDFAVGVASIVALLDPGLVVVGGGIGAREGLAARLESHVTELCPTQCKVVTSILGERAGVIGALALARRHALTALLSGKTIPSASGEAA